MSAPAPVRASRIRAGAGADVAGLFFNRATVEQPPFARAFLR